MVEESPKTQQCVWEMPVCAVCSPAQGWQLLFLSWTLNFLMIFLLFGVVIYMNTGAVTIFSQSKTLIQRLQEAPPTAATWLCNSVVNVFNSLWPSDAIQQLRSGSALAQVNNGLSPDGTRPLPGQCWFISKDILGHSPESNFTKSSHKINLYHVYAENIHFENYCHISLATLDFINFSHRYFGPTHQGY